MKKTNNRNRGGFTLIEMLVVIAIIMILTGIVVTNFTSAKAKARDAKRVSDLSQIQLALEQYFDRCGAYPDAGANTMIDMTTDCASGNVNMSDFISKLPTDPINSGDYVYAYGVDVGLLDYTLKAVLERENSIVRDGVGNDTFNLLECSIVLADKVYCLGPK